MLILLGIVAAIYLLSKQKPKVSTPTIIPNSEVGAGVTASSINANSNFNPPATTQAADKSIAAPFYKTNNAATPSEPVTVPSISGTQNLVQRISSQLRYAESSDIVKPLSQTPEPASEQNNTELSSVGAETAYSYLQTPNPRSQTIFPNAGLPFRPTGPTMPATTPVAQQQAGFSYQPVKLLVPNPAPQVGFAATANRIASKVSIAAQAGTAQARAAFEPVVL